MPSNSPGVAHLAFLVDDIQERHARMAAAGVTFRNPPVRITPAGTNEGGWACYFDGPDGETLELLEPPAERRRAMVAAIATKSSAGGPARA